MGPYTTPPRGGRGGGGSRVGPLAAAVAAGGSAFASSPMSGIMTRGAAAAARPPPPLLDLGDEFSHFLAEVDDVVASPRHAVTAAGGGGCRPTGVLCDDGRPVVLSPLFSGDGGGFAAAPDSAVSLSRASLCSPSQSSVVDSPLVGGGCGGDGSGGSSASGSATPLLSSTGLGVDHLFLACTSPFDPVTTYPPGSGQVGGPAHQAVAAGVASPHATPEAAVRDLERMLAADPIDGPAGGVAVGGDRDDHARGMSMDDGWGYGPPPAEPLTSRAGGQSAGGATHAAVGLLDELSPPPARDYGRSLTHHLPASDEPSMMDMAAESAAAAFDVNPNFERFLDAAVGTESAFFGTLTMHTPDAGRGGGGGVGGGGGGGAYRPPSESVDGPSSSASSLCARMARACALPGGGGGGGICASTPSIDRIRLPPSIAATNSPSDASTLTPSPAAPTAVPSPVAPRGGRGMTDYRMMPLPPPRSSLAVKAHAVPAGASPGGERPAELGMTAEVQTTLRCSSCPAVFRKQHNLSKHVRSVHLRKRPHVCSMCNSAFGEKNKLVKHRLTVHEKQRNYDCRLCALKFGQASDLKRHVNIVHKGHRPYSCTACIGRAFGRKASLKQHLMSMHRHKAGSGELKKVLEHASQVAAAAIAASAAVENDLPLSDGELDGDGDDDSVVGAGVLGTGSFSAGSLWTSAPLSSTHSRDALMLGASLAGASLGPAGGGVSPASKANAAAAAAAAAASAAFAADPYGGIDTLAVPDDHARRLRLAAAAAAAQSVRLPRR